MMQLKNPKHSVFSGRQALIVGGTGGIGYAVAKELAARGTGLILHGREQSRCSQARSRLLETYPSAQIRCWVHEFAGTPAFMEALEPLLQEEGEEPDIVVCAFGPLLTGKLEDMTPAAWSLLADANLALPGALASRCMA
ncbi:MAG: SDR family NAD(P)-dependent oxidoreductase, partial [Spirochaetales bacterium]|nr:SDR family NAD(P)-dependent oxidoreductase [Spirochaetales bacterium]